MSKKLTKLEIINIAKQYSNKTDFLEYGGGAYVAAKKMGIFEEVTSHMPKNCLSEKDPYNKKWTEETIKIESLKYNSRYGLKKNNPSAFNAAKAYGLLEILYPQKQKFRNIPYTYEEVRAIVKQYNTRTELKSNNPYIYRYVSKHHKEILDELYSHMKKSISVSIPEKQLLSIIKKQYKNAKKLMDRNITVPNIPRLKGLDIDIFVPELNRGIEFDGTYWHGKAFKRVWTNDPDEYHRVKDAYFLEKGIQILHIKEEEWNSNMEECIRKCFNFLSKNNV